MTSSDPIRFGAMPIANVVRLTRPPSDGLGVACIVTARSRSLRSEDTYSGREDLDPGLKNS